MFTCLLSPPTCTGRIGITWPTLCWLCLQTNQCLCNVITPHIEGQSNSSKLIFWLVVSFSWGSLYIFELLVLISLVHNEWIVHVNSITYMICLPNLLTILYIADFSVVCSEYFKSLSLAPCSLWDLRPTVATSLSFFSTFCNVKPTHGVMALS